jgi:hypothetical protein
MPSGTAEEIDDPSDHELRTAFEERAAFMEIDGGLSRAQAEARAAEELGMLPRNSEAAE